jgi:L-asparagine transporter-like permease
MSRTTLDTPPTAPDAHAPLSHGLKQRHLSMIALGGVIGAGLFVGSGAGIAAAGPSIVIAYAVSGLLVMLVMRMLGEMSAAYPSSGSFSAHAERAIGPWAGFTAGRRRSSPAGYPARPSGPGSPCSWWSSVSRTSPP